jgi:hypothetical protein
MKKYVFLILVSHFFILQIFAQQKPIIGYDKVLWGTSVQEVRNIYSINENIKIEPSGYASDITLLKQENVSNIIKSRWFEFIDNKLFCVHVFYNDMSQNTVDGLNILLERNYGKLTKFNNAFSIDTYFYDNYSPDISVRLNKSKDDLAITYIGTKYRDEYRVSKLEL